jgi:hypothetical protein
VELRASTLTIFEAISVLDDNWLIFKLRVSSCKWATFHLKQTLGNWQGRAEGCIFGTVLKLLTHPLGRWRWDFDLLLREPEEAKSQLLWRWFHCGNNNLKDFIHRFQTSIWFENCVDSGQTLFEAFCGLAKVGENTYLFGKKNAIAYKGRSAEHASVKIKMILFLNAKTLRIWTPHKTLISEVFSDFL